MQKMGLYSTLRKGNVLLMKVYFKRAKKGTKGPFYICVECASSLLKSAVKRSSSPLLHFLL